jgi:uncharacterized phage-associated protein
MYTAGMKRRLDTTKAAQAAAVLLRARPGKRDNYMRILKLLYLANRAALAEIGRPIFADRFVAMERGPLPSGVYDLIKGTHYDVERWAPYFQTDHYDLVMTEEPGLGALNPFEVETLQKVAKAHEDHDEWALVEETHKLPEWIKNDPGKSSRVIPLADLLEAVGVQASEQEVRDAMARRERLAEAFRRTA